MGTLGTQPPALPVRSPPWLRVLMLPDTVNPKAAISRPSSVSQ
jgi:hypothetical protein